MEKRKITLLRITYWWGIVADAVETVRMVFPDLFVASTGAAVERGPGLQLALLYGAPVMLGWTLLLFWADRKPLERKGVLLCLIPVVVSYVLVELYAVARGIIPLQNMVPVFLLQPLFLFLIVFSYRRAREG
ncbi:MAG: hypothetical protein JXA20_13915 [Spirochaetes bacterium]|nr:hypothetical protein [Spirochaetota bacterium]